MRLAVIHGAVLECTCGSIPSSLSVTSNQKVTIEKKLAATIQDCQAANVGTFGVCKKLTADAGGTPAPCKPTLPGPWAPGSTSPVTIGGKPALRSTDQLKCVATGVITIKQAGQGKTSMDR